jgi:hypothetical protein
VAVVELYLELGIGQRVDNGPVHLDRVVFRHDGIVADAPWGPCG